MTEPVYEWRLVFGLTCEVNEIGEIRNATTKNPIQGQVTDRGYRVFSSWDGEMTITLYAHRAVAMAFLDPPDDPTHVVVRHRDGDMTNNHWSNLQWGTQGENLADRVKHRTNGRKLTNEHVLEIRRAEGSHREIGLKYGVSKPLVQKIKDRTRWFNLPDDYDANIIKNEEPERTKH